jgi:1-acyl-sn-glycerol-3-phosphate acyltransferase
MTKILTWPLRFAFGTYCWVTFLAFGLVALLVMLVVPGLERRRRIAQVTAKISFAFMGIRLRTEELERLPKERCVVVANHASYLDGVVMTAVLPPRYSFVIKKEMSRYPLAGHLLQRIGSEFVDRQNRHQGGMDARRMLRRASKGASLVFFPEGTFSRHRVCWLSHRRVCHCGSRKCPLVVAVIRGTRQVLPSHRVAPRPGAITVELIAILQPQLDHADAATLLRDEARRVLLTHLGEPDLSHLTDASLLLGETA